MRTILAALIALSIPSISASKCVAVTVEIDGVVEHRSKNPAKGAVVAVSWVRNGLPQGPAMALTDDEGRYSVSFQFDTFSSSSILRGDRCTSDLTHVSISAFTPGYRSEFLAVQLSDFRASATLHLDPSSQ